MAHARTHPRQRRGGGAFTGLLLGGAFILALLIGWVVWGGGTPDLRDRAASIDIEMPRAPRLPATPNPEPLPLPSPARPG
ncbi:MAG TPA: hypothetical protein VEA44_12045 [Caulobacter sp.]|nr:hypothetical protein [Caulobacter sp.]